MSDVAKKYGSIPQGTREKLQAQVRGVEAAGVSSPGETVKAPIMHAASYPGDNGGSGSGKGMAPDVAQGVNKTTDDGPMGRPARDYAAAHAGQSAAPAKQDAAHKYGSKPDSPESALSAEDKRAVENAMKGTGVKGAGAEQSVAAKYGARPKQADQAKEKTKESPSK